MTAITITLLVGAVWLLGLLAVVAVCRSAARGDRAVVNRLADSHEHALLA